MKLHDKAERHFLGRYASCLLRLRADEKGTIVSPFLFCFFKKNHIQFTSGSWTVFLLNETPISSGETLKLP